MWRKLRANSIDAESTAEEALHLPRVAASQARARQTAKEEGEAETDARTKVRKRAPTTQQPIVPLSCGHGRRAVTAHRLEHSLEDVARVDDTTPATTPASPS